MTKNVNDGWKIDIRKTIKRYEAKENTEYPYSTFYRKEKVPILLRDGIGYMVKKY